MSAPVQAYDADVIVVGSGVLGSLAATHLAKAGKSVIILEAGPRIDRATVFENYRNAFDLNDYDAPFPQLPYAQMWSTPGYIQQKGPLPLLAPYLRGVGGTTWHWASAAWRLIPNDFKMKTLYGQGRDWPIGYDDLEVWYNRAEIELGVNGDSNEDQSGQGGPPFPPRSAPYPMAAQPFSSMNRKVKALFDAAGYPTIHEPNARATRDYDGRPACVGSNNCSIAACPLCGAASRRVHSRYIRQVSDLPCSGRRITFALSRAGLSAARPIAGAGSSPNASVTPCLRSGHGARRGSNASSIISGWRWAADRRRASPGD